MSAAFSPLIQAVEVGLRNSLNDALSRHFGADWFEQWVTKEANHLRATGTLAPGKKSEGERLIANAKRKIQQRDLTEYRRRGQRSLPPGYIPGWQSVLAELTFGFWVRLLTRWYWDINHNSKLWPNHLSAVFSGAPPALHAVGALHNAFEAAVDMRNRIHHQEPLWKYRTVASIDDAILRLQDHLARTLKLLDYLSPNKRAALIKYGVVASIEELCTKDTFQRFIGRHHGVHRPLKSAKKDLRLIAKNTKDHQSVWVLSEGLSPQLVVRNANRRFF